MTRVFCGCCGELKRVDFLGKYWYAFDAIEDGCPKCMPEDKPEDIDPDTVIETGSEDIKEK